MRGLASLLPTLLTIVVIIVCYRFVRDNVAAPINHLIHKLLVNTKTGREILATYGGVEIDVDNLKYRVGTSREWLSFAKVESRAEGDPRLEGEVGPGDEPRPARPRRVDREKLREILEDAVPPLLGFLLAVLILFLISFLLATYVGRTLFSRFEKLLSKFPVVKMIYPYAKQLVDFFFKEKKLDFNTVVAFEYPRRGIWALGFMTGQGLRQLHQESERRLVSVFIPSSPAPMTGYTIFVPIEDVIPMDLDVEEAFRLIITGGVVVPDSQLVALPEPLENPGAQKKTPDRLAAPRGKKKAVRPTGSPARPGKAGSGGGAGKP